MEELIKRLERVIATGAPDKDGMHPISAETVLEVVKQLSEHSTNLAEVGTDAISRRSAIEIIEDYPHGDWNVDTMSDMVGKIKQLPPIQPKRGKWIDLHIKEEVYGEMYKCSVCGDFDFGGCFCPNCGADMRSDDMREVTT